MNSNRKKMVYNLLKGIKTGAPESIKRVNEKKVYTAWRPVFGKLVPEI